MHRWSGFDLVRVGAALCVVLSHALLLSGRVAEPKPLSFGPDPWSLGVCGVAVFFVVSGFLVTGSWTSGPSLGAFALRRASRIWPALVVVVVLVALVVGTAVTSLSAADYLRSPGTWSYVVRNVLLVTQLRLPGVFDDNPLDVVNGSLWSLPLEVACYLLVAALGVLGLLRRKAVVLGLALAALLLSWLFDAGLLVVPEGTGTVRRLAPALVALFLVGAAFRTAGLPAGRAPLLLAAAGVVLAQVVPVPAAGYVGAAYLVLRAGTTTTAAGRRLRRLGDPSYGTFLWGWPVSQLLVLAGLTQPALLAAASAVLALALGYASWWLLERRALQAAHRRLASVRAAGPLPT